MGVTGLLNIPMADMQVDGTFMVGANYLPEQMLPDFWDYNSGNYFLNVTFLPCLEVGYRCTLMKLKTGKWNQDRSVSLRIRPLKEGRYWPSVVVGSNDALITHLQVQLLLLSLHQLNNQEYERCNLFTCFYHRPRLQQADQRIKGIC